MKLSNASLEVLAEVVGGYSDSFTLDEPFPGTDVRSGAMRIVLRRMARDGVLELVPAQRWVNGEMVALYRIPPAAKRAAIDWECDRRDAESAAS